MSTQDRVESPVKINIQAVGVKSTHYLEQKIALMAKKLKAHASFVDAVDIHLNAADNHIDTPRTVLVRCSIPGDDVAASDSGFRWKIILRNVEKKLLRQLEKKKAMFRQIEN